MFLVSEENNYYKYDNVLRVISFEHFSSTTAIVTNMSCFLSSLRERLFQLVTYLIL